MVKKMMAYSYKGGAGKTLLSVNIANILSNQFDKKVLLIESDFRMPTYTKIFSNNNPDMFFNDFLTKEDILTDYIYSTDPYKFDIIYAYPKFRPNDKINHESQENYRWYLSRADLLSKEMDQLNYDLIIFDLTPGNHFFPIISFTICDEVLFILRPNNESIQGTNQIISKVYSKVLTDLQIKDKQLRLILNQTPHGENVDWHINIKQNQLKSGISKYVSSFDNLFYENKTDFFIFSKNEIILKSDDPLVKKLQRMIADYWL